MNNSLQVASGGVPVESSTWLLSLDEYSGNKCKTAGMSQLLPSLAAENTKGLSVYFLKKMRTEKR